MSISKKDISVIIVSFKSDHVIHKCIKSIDKSIDILVVDNSNNYEFKKHVEQKYKNVKCILSNNNIGMGAGNNLAIKNLKKKFALILNPDVLLKKNTIKEIIEASKNIKSFAILAPISDQKENLNYKLENNEIDKVDESSPFKVKSVDGFAMLLNIKKLKKIKNFNFFDENFFLYLENDDLCKRIIDYKENIYVIPRSKIKHLGGKAVNPKYKNEIEFSRNWHWMWSKFYYNKKHYGYSIAIIKVLKNMLSSKLKFIYYSLTFNHYKRKIYQMRLLGLLNSMIGIKSFYRPKIKN
jgi:N-acetylglucosaminyl-diphospho-decaprenol L-rhamnosyltransferase